MDNQFHFNISLSVLNHLWRNLYRNFITVLWEAISNSWDADTENVWINIDKETNSFTIIDDWDGMSNEDFQNKFLKIWYSKRKDSTYKSKKGRIPIGKKGIGKLALLSCAEEITIISKTNTEIISGKINNSWLDRAITNDLLPEDYPLEQINIDEFKTELSSIQTWTIIHFSKFNEEIKNTINYLKKLIALSFKFSLYDHSFNIFLNSEKISFEDLSWISDKTEFLWEFNNDNNDPFIEHLSKIKESKIINTKLSIKGFIASVEKPSDLNILWTWEKATIDLFVNGRIREKDILKHIPTTRVVESYLYGQIFFDNLDDWWEIDRFTSSREWIISNDSLYQDFLDEIKDKVKQIMFDRDKRRRENRKDWDSENSSIPRKERKAQELFNSISEDFIEWVKNKSDKNSDKEIVEQRVDNLSKDASYNFTSYGECFISENLLRKYIDYSQYPLSTEIKWKISDFKLKEQTAKNKWNISIEVRQSQNDLLYSSMDDLACLVDKVEHGKEAWLSRDACEYKPMRDAMAHTALLTSEAKFKLTSVFNNIKWRVITLLTNMKNSHE